MHYQAIIVSLLAATVAAKSCKRGGSYCGYSLLRRGKYHDHIVNTLKEKGLPADERHIHNSRFDCLSNGEIAYRQFCSLGCGGTDTQDPDYCL